MNFLAHLHLSCSDEFLLVGNYLADMLTLKESSLLPKEYQKGIKLHRLIDSYTDNNVNVRSLNALLVPYVGKYAPVATDVVFDYFLAKNWEQFNHLTLQEFCYKSYNSILSYLHVAPQKVQDITKEMIEDNFLIRYSTFEGLDFVFTKMNNRARYNVDFKKVLIVLEKENNLINKVFLSFYPSIIKEVNIFCSC